MISALYVEESIWEHPRALALRERFAKVPHIRCERYGEVFNRHGQDFRVQKSRPALILAEKHRHHVLPTPPGYGIGGQANYYFSHILNCLYDCRYCFLQGLYQSANYVFFLNFEAFQLEMKALLDKHHDNVYFFSGYDGDSFALESLTGFVRAHLPFFAQHPRAQLELRTKSLKAKDLAACTPLPNVIVAFTLTPERISREWESGVPPLAKRLDVMQALAEQGWPIGLRMDPIIPIESYQQHYGELLDQVFQRLEPAQIHSATLGSMRFPKAMHKTMVKLHPEEPLFATSDPGDAPVSWLSEQLGRWLPASKIFPCT